MTVGMDVAQRTETPNLKAAALHWTQVASLGVAIAISGNTAGWNYGLGVGGWGGMTAAALAMVGLFFCLTQVLAELAAALPGVGGFEGYVARASGDTSAYATGMAVAIALSVGAGLAISFAESYLSGWLGLHGWPVKFVMLGAVVSLQLRGVQEAVGLTVIVGSVSVVILIIFCAFMVPAFQLENLFSEVAGHRSMLPHGMAGALRCIPFAVFLFLGVEQAAHAASEMKDMQKAIPKALTAAILVAFVVGMAVLIIATGATGAEALAKADDPLLTVISLDPHRAGVGVMRRLIAAGALIAILGTFFSLAYAASRQIFHLAGANLLPKVLRRVNSKQAPTAAILLVACIALVSSAFPANSTMVVFTFLISVSYFLLLVAFIRLRRQESALVRPYRALGGQPAAAIALLLSLAVMISCYQLEGHALQMAILLLAILALHFVTLHPAGSRRWRK